MDSDFFRSAILPGSHMDSSIMPHQMLADRTRVTTNNLVGVVALVVFVLRRK